MSILANQPHAWIWVVLLALGAGYVFWFYRRIPPTVSRRLASLLATLRALALLVLLVLLMEPVLAVTRNVAEAPLIAVLLDRSRSMSISDGTGGIARGEEALALLNEIVLPRLGRERELRAYAFASQLDELDVERGRIGDAPALDGEVTDVSDAFSSIRGALAGENLRAVVVATDGAHNRGSSPYDAAVSLGVPVFTLGLGSTEAKADIAIRDAVTNRISYSGEAVPVRVTVSSVGFAGSGSFVELREDDVLLDSVPIELSGTGEEREITFRVVPDDPGIHRYRIVVPSAPGELTTANNERVVATSVLKGKIRALLLASRPGWDFAFLRRELEADTNVELTAVAARTGAVASSRDAVPQSREELSTYDLVILVEPNWSSLGFPGEWLEGFVEGRGGGLLVVGPLGAVLAGGDARSESVLSLLPVVISGERAAATWEVRSRLTEEGESSPTTRIVSDRFENADLWTSLPPVWTVADAGWVPRADARTLLFGLAPTEENVPLIVARRTGSGNVMSVLASGLWRWKMAGPAEVDVYDRFVSNATRWLTARGELERVVVTTDKDVYASGEPAHFSAQVYREDFRLARDADVNVSLSRARGAAPLATFALGPDGDFYRGAADPLVSGRYFFEAEARISGESVGVSEGEFTVEAFSLEDSEVRRRSALLSRLAADTGGEYYTAETIDRFPESIPLEWSQRTSRSEMELWNSPWLLLAFVGLISVEWTVRRYKGLP